MARPWYNVQCTLYTKRLSSYPSVNCAYSTAEQECLTFLNAGENPSPSLWALVRWEKGSKHDKSTFGAFMVLSRWSKAGSRDCWPCVLGRRGNWWIALETTADCQMLATILYCLMETTAIDCMILAHISNILMETALFNCQASIWHILCLYSRLSAGDSFWPGIWGHRSSPGYTWRCHTCVWGTAQITLN